MNFVNCSRKFTYKKTTTYINFFLNSHQLLKIKFQPNLVFKITIAVISSLVLIGTLGQFYQYLLLGGNDHQLIKLFYLNGEKNIPAAYSSLALLFCSFLLAIVAKGKLLQRDAFRIYWVILSWTFLLLALDEAVSIHERSIPFTRNLFNTDGFLYYAWIIPGIFLCSIFLGVYLRFLLALPQKTKFLLLFSGLVFVSGAIGMEMIGGKVFVMQNHSQNNLFYSLITVVEETLEMLGVSFFIYTLLDYIKKYIDLATVKVIFGGNTKTL